MLLTHNNRAEHHAVSSDYLIPISRNDDNIILCDNQDTEVISEMEIPESRRRPQSVVSDYFIPVNINTHTNVTSRDTLNSQSDDYLHPYTSFINNLQKDTVTAYIHRDDQESPDLDKEVNDHKYLHVYEQLRHDSKDNCPSYMLPPCPLQLDIAYRTTNNISVQNTEKSSTIQKDGEEKIFVF